MAGVRDVQAEALDALCRWYAGLAASYLRYSRDCAHAWAGNAPGELCALVREFAALEDAGLARLVYAIERRGAHPPQPAFGTEITHLNYMALEVIVERALPRIEALMREVVADTRVLKAGGALRVASKGDAMAALLAREVDALRPLVAKR